MNRVIFLLLVAVSVLPAAADTHIKLQTHTDGYYQGGTMNPPEDRTTEMWIGDGKLAVVTDIWLMVCDRTQGQVWLANRPDKTYVQTAFPLDLTKVVSDEESKVLRRYRQDGEVKAAGETRSIGGRECRRWDLQQWILVDGNKFYEQEIVAWYAVDLPFSMEQYLPLQLNVYGLENLGEAFVGKLQQIPGLRLSQEAVRYEEGQAIKTSSRLLEMVTGDAPAGTYAVPADFTRKEKFTVNEIFR